MVEAFQATKIDPPCFLLDFADLGPGQEILGSPVLGQEIYAKYGLTKSRVTSSINSYKLPIFYAPTDSTRSQPLANSLDINKYLLEKEIETKRKVLRKEYRRVARGRVLDPLFRTSGRRKKAEG
ncbi:MAG: hypothetical protein LBI10_02890 [Deltaproteobacteria bacterium]|nr:hypothetical protein [Deltaproteobacteria bacterium]